MADKTDKQETFIERFQRVVTQAEAVKDAPQPVNRIAFHVDSLQSYIKAMSSDDQKMLAEALGQQDTLKVVKTLGALGVFAEVLSQHKESTDRTEGNLVASAFKANAALPGQMSPEDIKAGESLLARWLASEPAPVGKATRGTRQSKAPEDMTFPPLEGWRATFTCKSCQTTLSTGRDNLNSARNQCIDHFKEHHPASASKSDGTTAFDLIGQGLVAIGLKARGSVKPLAEGVEPVASIERDDFTFARKPVAVQAA